MVNLPDPLRIGLSSKGSYEEATNRFLSGAGLGVWRPNPRQYVGRIGSIPGAEVRFQRPEDIVHKIADGSIDIGITGYDLVAEHTIDNPNVCVVIQDLGFRRCELVLAIPDHWLDIRSIDDLAELAIVFKRDGRELRVATKFQNLTTEYLYRHGVNYFALVGAHGALEAAPSLGYADVIVDLTQTGVTLRDNRLRVIDGGVILQAQACMIVNHRTIAANTVRLEQARMFIEYCEATLSARYYRVVTANVSGESEQDVAEHVLSDLELAGERGPTISPVVSKHCAETAWYSVSIIVPEHRMLAAVDHLRVAGSTGITVRTPDFMFGNKSKAFTNLEQIVANNAGETRFN